MVVARTVNKMPLARIKRVPADHAGTPLAVIDAVASFIDEHDGHCRTRLQHLSHLDVLYEAGASQGRRICVAAIKPTEHGITAYPRVNLARTRCAQISVVAWTPPYRRTVSTIGPQITLLHGKIRIPVILVLAV